MTHHYIYDIESTANFFSCIVRHVESQTRWIFEVSDRHNMAADFYYFIRDLQNHGCRMVGFNNLEYDYRVVHHLMQIGPTFTAFDAFQKTYQIIVERKAEMIWPSDYIVKQIDLFKIHHFDNVAKRTGLKTLEFNMRSLNIGDMPFEPGSALTFDQMELALIYNAHDVDETERFFQHTKPMIDFRDELSAKTGVDMTNFNDTKIGKKYFEMELEKARPGITGTYQEPNRTLRNRGIPLGEVIFPYIEFESQAFNNVLSYLKNCRITETNSPPELKDLSATLNGFQFDFGTGGIHGSVTRRHVRPADDEELIDVDVASYYPNLAIKNRVYPEHLSDQFCDIYEALYQQRKQYAKKSSESAMLKLALNGVYGDSNNIYSRCFYDPQYTMTITVNGQLLLCLLAEKLMLHTNCEMIQINTDGVTVLLNKSERPMFDKIFQWWQNFTRLELEENLYSAMWVRDVNNYIAQTVKGDIKRIGAYAHKTAREEPATREVQWHKDHSALVVPKAAEAAMVHGQPVADFISSHTDPFDFTLRGKVNAGSKLELDDGTPLQRVTRYIVANTDRSLFKVMPPLPSKPGSDPRRFAINKGWNVHVCNDMKDFRPELLNLEWYIQEAEKLVIR